MTASAIQPPTLCDRRAGKIDEALLCQPTLAVTEAAAPGPMAKERVDQPGRQDGDQQIAAKAHALSGGAGDDGRGGGAEHGLKQEKSGLPGIQK